MKSNYLRISRKDKFTNSSRDKLLITTQFEWLILDICPKDLALALQLTSLRNTQLIYGCKCVSLRFGDYVIENGLAYERIEGNSF